MSQIKCILPPSKKIVPLFGISISANGTMELPKKRPQSTLDVPFLSSRSASIQWASHIAVISSVSVGSIPSFPPPGPSPDAPGAHHLNVSQPEGSLPSYPALVTWHSLPKAPHDLTLSGSLQRRKGTEGRPQVFRARVITEVSLRRQQELFRQRNLGWGGRQSDEHCRLKEQNPQKNPLRNYSHHERIQ